MDRWGYWLNEPIFTGKGLSFEKRKHALYMFCRQGLIPLVESHGYRFRFNENELLKIVLSLLYKLYEGQQVKCCGIEIDNSQEQYDTFCYKLDTDIWDDFWKRWGTLQDFEEGRYAHRLQYELPGFVWSWLDFERSPTILNLYEQLEDDEALEETKGKEDPYLQETSKRDYQDRHW